MTQGSGSVVLRGGTVLTVDATHRVLPGTEVSTTTPLPGLWEVGDGVKPVGWVGTSGAAESARLVAAELVGS